MPGFSPVARFLFWVLIAMVAVTSAAEEEAVAPPNPWMEPVCRVDGVEIRRGDVESELLRLLPTSVFHGSVDEEQKQGLRRQAVQELVDKALKVQDAERRKVRVSDREVKKALQAVVDKYPDEAAFRAKLFDSGATIDQLKEELRHRHMVEKAEAKVADADRKVSKREARRYYEENLARFNEPRRAVVRQLLVKVPPLDRTEEVWQVAEAKVAAALSRIESGESFETLVREVSEVPDDEKLAGGLLGAIHVGQLQPAELDQAIWTLPEGGVSQPIRTFKGVYLLKVDRFLPERQVPFDEIQEKLRADLQAKWSQERVATWLAKLRADAKIEYLDPALAPAE